MELLKNTLSIIFIIGAAVVAYRLEKGYQQCPKCGAQWSVKRKKHPGLFHDFRACIGSDCDFQEDIPLEGTLLAPKEEDA